MSIQQTASTTLIQSLKAAQGAAIEHANQAGKEATRAIKAAEGFAHLAESAPKDQPGHSISKTWQIEHGIDPKLTKQLLKVRDGITAANLRLLGVIERQTRPENASRKASSEPPALTPSLLALAGALRKVATFGLDDAAKQLLLRHWGILETLKEAAINAPIAPRDCGEQPELEGVNK